MTVPQLLQQILHYATLPGAMGLVCVLAFMLGERRRGQLLMLSLSAAVSINLLLKELFKIPRPWLMHVETAPYLAEGGYALPCLHTQLAVALFGSFALTAKNKSVRFLCAAAIWLTAAVRVLTGLQSISDVLSGAAVGILVSFILSRYWYLSKTNERRSSHRPSSDLLVPVIILLPGLVSAISFCDGWGLGLCLTVIVLSLLSRPFQKAEANRNRFLKIYSTTLAAGAYTGLIIFLPFLIEWLITPLWPGQALLVFLITLIPCLFRLM